MSFLDSFFTTENTLTLAIYTCSQTKTNGVLGPKVYTLAKTIEKSLFWRDSMNRSNVSEKYKADVLGVIAVRPEDALTTDFLSINKLTLTNTAGTLVGTFSAIYCNDVGSQGKLLEIPVKEFAN